MKKLYQVTLAALLSAAFSTTVSAQCVGPICAVERPDNCPAASAIGFTHEAGGGLCTGTLAHLNAASNLVSFDWDWELFNESGSVTDTVEAFFVPYSADNWTNFNLNVCVVAKDADGGRCSRICKTETLSCGFGR